MSMELTQPTGVDGAVIDPDTLQQAGGSRRPLTEKESLVGQVQHVAHGYAASL
jgi:hypothetical protein